MRFVNSFLSEKGFRILETKYGAISLCKQKVSFQVTYKDWIADCYALVENYLNAREELKELYLKLKEDYVQIKLLCAHNLWV